MHLIFLQRQSKLFLPIVNDLGEVYDNNNSKEKISLDTNKITFLFFGLIRKSADSKGKYIL